MAKYEVKWGCGCEETVQLIGPITSRHLRIAKMEGNNCPKCALVSREERTARINRELKLEALRGTEKQVRWASDLRADFAEKNQEFVSLINGCEIAREAHWWIESKDFAYADIKNVLRLMPLFQPLDDERAEHFRTHFAVKLQMAIEIKHQRFQAKIALLEKTPEKALGLADVRKQYETEINRLTQLYRLFSEDLFSTYTFWSRLTLQMIDEEITYESIKEQYSEFIKRHENHRAKVEEAQALLEKTELPKLVGISARQVDYATDCRAKFLDRMAENEPKALIRFLRAPMLQSISAKQWIEIPAKSFAETVRQITESEVNEAAK